MSFRQDIVETSKKEEAALNLRMPIRGVIDRPLPEYEAVAVQGAYQPGINKYYIRHPYMGVNSWIRVMPEAGTEILTQQRGDRKGEEIAGYLASGRDETIRRARKGLMLYRVLNPGELELMSSGRSYLHMNDRGDIEMRGGILEQDMSQSELEHRMYAPTYVRKLHLHNPLTLQNEERIGVAKRWIQAQSVADRFIRYPSTNEFAIEYRRQLTDKADHRLISFAEGHVMGAEKGEVINNPLTNRPLRYFKAYYTENATTRRDRIVHFIDDKANHVLSTGVSSSVETLAEIGSKGTLKITGQTLSTSFSATGTMRFGRQYTISTPFKGEIIADQLLLLRTATNDGILSIKSPSISIGSSLKTYFPALNTTQYNLSILEPSWGSLSAFTKTLGRMAYALSTMAAAIKSNSAFTVPEQATIATVENFAKSAELMANITDSVLRGAKAAWPSCLSQTVEIST